MSIYFSKVPTIIRLIVGATHGRLRFRAAFVLYFLILVIGSIPGARAAIGQVASGLALHASAYSVIAFLLFTGLNHRLPEKALRSLLLVAFLGAMDECLQSFLPYRVAAMRDWLVDVIAGFLTIFLSQIAWWLRQRQRANGNRKDSQ